MFFKNLSKPPSFTFYTAFHGRILIVWACLPVELKLCTIPAMTHKRSHSEDTSILNYDQQFVQAPFCFFCGWCGWCAHVRCRREKHRESEIESQRKRGERSYSQSKNCKVLINLVCISSYKCLKKTNTIRSLHLYLPVGGNRKNITRFNRLNQFNKWKTVKTCQEQSNKT